MAQYKFVTPSVKETPAGDNRLFMRYGIDCGITIMMSEDINSTYRFPSQTDALAATEVYLGGREYIIDEITRTRLTNTNIGGNYGDYITAI